MSTPHTTLEEHSMDTTLDVHTGRHPINTGHLVMGLVFAGLVGIWALIAGDVVADDDISWLLPIPWVAGGAIGLAAATYANVRSRRTTSSAGRPAPAAGADWSATSPEADRRHESASDTTQSWSTDDTDPTRRLTDDTDPTEEIR